MKSEWNDIAVLDFAKKLLASQGGPVPDKFTVYNFQAFFDNVRSAVAELPSAERANLSPEWATRLHRLADDFAERVARDPLLVYVPRTAKHLAFHSDKSFIRHLPAANGIGKAIQTSELVKVFGGWKAAGELKIGDRVAALDGTYVKVLGVYPQGIRPIYTVTFSDGTTARVDGEHLWTVQTKHNRANGTFCNKTTLELAAYIQNRPAYNAPSLPKHDAVEGYSKVPLDPYTLGALIADGCLGGAQINVAIHGEKRRLQHVLPRSYLGHKTGNYQYLKAWVRDEVRALGLAVNSPYRFIPPPYLESSIEDRRALLKGLCDADGSVDKTGRRCSYSTKSKRLAEDVASLVRSLGGWAKVHAHTHKGHEGLEYVVLFVCDGAFSPDTSKYARLTARRSMMPLRRVVSVKQDKREEETVCILIDHPSHVFLLHDYIPTHNTIAEYVEAYWQATGQRHFSTPGNVAVLATGHSVYSLDVFQRKMLEGENGDPYSPYIPENGYWFHSYDRRTFTLRLACPSCAEKGKPKACSHVSSIKCLSADSGVGRLMGFTVPFAISDELTPKETWDELVQRVIRVRGRMVVGATPLGGLEHWTTELITQAADPKFAGIISGFNLSKLDCIGSPGGPTWSQIMLEHQTLSKTAFAVRVLGQVKALGDSIFNLGLLDRIEKEEVQVPQVGNLYTTGAQAEQISRTRDIRFEENEDGTVEVWEAPLAEHCYVMGTDIATGIRQEGVDASCTYVFKVTEDLGAPWNGPGFHNEEEEPEPQKDSSAKKTVKELQSRPCLKMVACVHGRYDTYEYAKQIKKLGLWYNEALDIPEVNTIGAAFLTDLKRHMDYGNIFMEEVGAEFVEDEGIEPKYGVVASESSNAAMVSALSWYLSNRRLVVRDSKLLQECRTFQRATKVGAGGSSYVKYAAAPGAYDDRVRAASLVAYACSYFPEQVYTSLNVGPAGEEETRKTGPYDPFGLLKGKKPFRP